MGFFTTLSTAAIIITSLTVTVTILQVIKHWIFAKGNLYAGYRLSVALYILCITMNTVIAFNDPSQITVLLLNIYNMWAFAMAFMGIFRLKKEKREKILRKKIKKHSLCPMCKERVEQKLIVDDQIEPAPIIIVE